jgi:hypothetical protein
VWRKVNTASRGVVDRRTSAMEALFQIGKELSELRSRVEALERTAGAHSEARSSSEYPSGATKIEPAQRGRILAPPAITHRAPNVPLFLDGEILEDPQEITKLNGTPLYCTPLRIDAGVALAAFTDPQAMIRESSRLESSMTTETAATSEHICTTNPDNLGERVQFWSDINMSGDTIGLNPGWHYDRLSGVPRGLFGNWNDVISSVDWCRWDVSLFEHTFAGGSQLWLRGGCNTPDLGIYGWNDRASTIYNWGARFSSAPIVNP